MDTFPDLGALSDEELKELIDQLTKSPAQEARRGRGRHHRR
jgi:hypothetical protein